jgi:hypothetical protein
MAALMLADGSSWIVCPRFNACRFSGPLDYSRTMVAITADLKTKVLALRRGPLLPFTAFMKFRGPQALKDTLRPACSPGRLRDPLHRGFSSLVASTVI